MCGIWVTCSKLKKGVEGIKARPVKVHAKANAELLENSLYINNRNRGPDSQQYAETIIEDFNGDYWLLRFVSTVLHLRGDETACQPLTCGENGHVLCWNGEVYSALTFTVDERIGDTRAVFEALCSAANTGKSIAATMADIRGPFAFSFFNGRTKQLWFGRDIFGRRSLLTRRTSDMIELSSVGTTVDSSSSDFGQVCANGVYCIDFGSPEIAERRCCWPKAYSVTDVASEAQCLYDVTDSKVLPSLTDLPLDMRRSVDTLEEKLRQSVSRRLLTIPKVRGECARAAILFSGGIDCTVLAGLADSVVPRDEFIDLVNVAFENPRSLKAREKENQHLNIEASAEKYNVPDRLTALKSLRELHRVYPSRKWRLVLVDVPYEEYRKHLKRVAQLVSPNDTVMDISIAVAFWFTARGVGRVFPSLADFESKSRVLISGLGADEQLGGYGRHKVAFVKGSFSAVTHELCKDVLRISERNLGRDDRVISDHGKEVRFPFLDEDLVQYLCDLPTWHKCDFRYEKGIGDKILLRLLAAKLGFSSVALEPKRAIQFGSRTAKMENVTSKGQDLFSLL